MLTEVLGTPSVDLRRFAGQFPTGVAVITTCDTDGKCTGITMSAVTSLSLDPPLFLICLDNKSQTLNAISSSGHFCINFLSDRQAHISKIFATKGEDKFRDVDYTLGVTGSPLIKGVVAHGECQAETSHQGGDHTILIARVVHTATYDGKPLVYHGGKYATLGEFKIAA
jgi:flavin reductase (DIM6/NTAB) family NADH-FMN oxidoreductase RutF